MTIPVWSYLEEYEAEKADLLAGVEKVFRSGRLILGESGKSFEAAFAQWTGTTHGVGVNSGTDALFLALRALGVGAGHEVITVANTAVPTVSAIVATGATPVFVDIDPKTYLMDVSQVAAKVTGRTKCLLPVHLFGQCVDMNALLAVAEKHGLPVLEDCAQSHGARFEGRMCGSMGKASAFSFYPTKILGAYGDGGMVCTADPALAAHVKRLRFYGMETQYLSVEQGYNSRLDEV